AAVFWVYGFPILMTIALGIAFRDKAPEEQIPVDVIESPGAAAVADALAQRPERFRVQKLAEGVALERLRKTKSNLAVSAPDSTGRNLVYRYDPVRAESIIAHQVVDDHLQRHFGRQDVITSRFDSYSPPGGRYIDFLIPGLLGMGLMGGGMWGVGFVTVDMRIRKLLKRFLATPMRRRDFLLAVMLSRFLFMIPEMAILITFSHFAFDVVVAGDLVSLLGVIVLGGFCFSGIGLLVASRAKTIETVSGIMNLVMLPMWILSGIFFSPERFPEVAQPVIQALPLTLLNNALRAVINDGSSLLEMPGTLLALLAWGLISFAVALRIFRWE
ncbi:MAG TPA: ABC transporter permease, partial [Gemmatales bacterium]|nr:ABC transporter permease [Gemmatales bacterium]